MIHDAQDRENRRAAPVRNRPGVAGRGSDVAPDLSNAIVFWSTIESETEESIDSVADGLASAAAFVRGRLARALPLRRMPRLSFRYDPTLEQGAEMLSLLREISDDETS